MSITRLMGWITWAEMIMAPAATAAWCQVTSTGSGNDFPTKPIRIVAGGSGGGADFAARLVAQGIAGPLGQQVIVDNRSSGVVPAQIVAQAPPDAYTLHVAGTNFWLGPLMQKTPYDPVKDFSPISWVAKAPNVLVVHPSVAAKSVKELITLARAKPGVLNYASGSTGGADHLAAELFKSMASVEIVRIPYKSGGASIAALVGGEVQMAFTGAAAVTPHLKSGRLRALAVTSAEPSALLPDLPTIAATGLPDYESTVKYGIFAPAGTPATRINRLNREVVSFLNTADAKDKALRVGVETFGSAPSQVAAAIKSDISKWSKLIKDAGIRAD